MQDFFAYLSGASPLTQQILARVVPRCFNMLHPTITNGLSTLNTLGLVVVCFKQLASSISIRLK